jgi:acetyltransferase-like isoleucine patch superfamily enzyme
MLSILRKIYSLLRYRIIILLINHNPRFKFIKQLQNPTQPITFEYWYAQKIKGINKHVPWPVHTSSRIVGVENITIGEGSFPGYMPGSYIQGLGKIVIGEFCIFAPNIGIISANHDIYDNAKHIHGKVELGNYCWIGMNAVILPGVKLGSFTIVAAGAVVTKSFEEGYCVVGGNPAKIIKNLEKDNCVSYKMNTDYIGYRKKTMLKPNLNTI